MSQSADHFDEFDEHTLLKHDILRSYLGEWARISLQSKRPPRRVHFVDAFAGPGRDKVGNPGSPYIACRIAAEVHGMSTNDKFGAGARMFVHALEDNQGRFATLTEQRREFEVLEPAIHKCYHGSLPKYIDEIRLQVEQDPTVYFLDPFGIKGLDAGTYPHLLSGPRHEVFALFSDLGANRLHGVWNADTSRIDDALADLHSSPFLFPEFNAEAEAALLSDREEMAKALDATKPAARTYLTRALGSDEWVTVLAQTPEPLRPRKFLELFLRCLSNAGAKIILVIPISDENGRYKHSLVHASKSARALTAMKVAVSTGLRREALSTTMRDRIAHDLSVPVNVVVDRLEADLAGAELDWSGPKGQDDGSLRKHVLEHTAIFPFQTTDLRTELARRGYLSKGHHGKMRVRFPALPTP